MKKIFFIAFSGAIVALSIIFLCFSPVINRYIPESENWKTANCEKLADDIEYQRDILHYTDDALKPLIRAKNRCNRTKAMYGLEHAALVLDIVPSFFCAILGILRYYDVGKIFEKITGIIGLITGIVGLVMTLVYTIYSGYIFTNDVIMSSGNPGFPLVYKLNEEGAFAEWDGEKYKCLYYDKNDGNALFAKYNELGKKQYNYDKEKEFPKEDSEFDNCRSRTENNSTSLSYPYPSYCSTNGFIISSQLSYKNNKGKKCKYLFYDQSYGFDYKYKYDNWITTLVVSNFIMACNIGLSIFGYLLFISDNGGYIKIKNDNMNFML